MIEEPVSGNTPKRRRVPKEIKTIKVNDEQHINPLNFETLENPINKEFTESNEKMLKQKRKRRHSLRMESMNNEQSLQVNTQWNEFNDPVRLKNSNPQENETNKTSEPSLSIDEDMIYTPNPVRRKTKKIFSFLNFSNEIHEKQEMQEMQDLQDFQKTQNISEFQNQSKQQNTSTNNNSSLKRMRIKMNPNNLNQNLISINNSENLNIIDRVRNYVEDRPAMLLFRFLFHLILIISNIIPILWISAIMILLTEGLPSSSSLLTKIFNNIIIKTISFVLSFFERITYFESASILLPKLPNGDSMIKAIQLLNLSNDRLNNRFSSQIQPVVNVLSYYSVFPVVAFFNIIAIIFIWIHQSFSKLLLHVSVTTLVVYAFISWKLMKENKTCESNWETFCAPFFLFDSILLISNILYLIQIQLEVRVTKFSKLKKNISS